MNKLKLFAVVIITFLCSIVISNKVEAYEINQIIEFNYENDLNNLGLNCVQHGNWVEHDDPDNEKMRYKVIATCTIVGQEAKGGNGATTNTIENAILAEGINRFYPSDGKTYTTEEVPVSAGLAYSRKYTELQMIFFDYYDRWCEASGKALNFEDSAGSNNNYKGSSSISSCSGAQNYSATLYMLEPIGIISTNKNDSPQRLIIAKPGSVETQIPTYDGYIIIKGKAWVNNPGGKANDAGDTFDNGGVALGGVQVRLKDASGNTFPGSPSSTTTDSNGNYTLKINLDTSYHVHKLYEDPSTAYNRLINGAYVEFEYDGMKYTTVLNQGSGENTSKATESSSSRSDYDKKYTTVDPSTTKTSATINATTRDTILSFATYPHQHTETEQVCIDWCNGNLTHDYTDEQNSYIVHTNIGCGNHLIITGYDYQYYTLDDPNTPNIDERGRLVATTEDSDSNYRSYLEERLIRDYSEDKYCDQLSHQYSHSLNSQTITNLVFEHVNIGLFEREQPNLGLFSDLSKVVVEKDNQQYTYLYNVRTTDMDKNDVGLQVKFQNKNTYTYRRPVNPSDIAYINSDEANKDKMKVYVSYEITIGNFATTLQGKVHKLVNYYDPEYTLVEVNGVEVSENNLSTNSNYKQCTIDVDMTVAAQYESAPVTITYEVSQDAIVGLLKQNATLNNVTEIHTYSTQYGEKTLYAEKRTSGRTGRDYAGYDIDSQPGNAGVILNNEGKLEATNLQDDTDIAPSFVLCQDTDDVGPLYKVLSGTVWEDTQTSESADKNERLGDGKKSDSETAVQNVMVELLKINDDLSTETAKLYWIKGSGETAEVANMNAITYTDAEGNYSFGNNGDNAEARLGVTTGNYIIRFTYGDGTKVMKDINGNEVEIPATTINGKTISARNYKSTIIANAEDNPIYKIFKGTADEYTTEKWHLSLPENYSIAVDDIERRLEIQSLKYSNFATPMNMISDSKPFNMQVEFDSPDSQTYQVNADGQPVDENGTVINDGEGFKHAWNIFDFGIIERPREELEIEKTVSKLKLTLANGQVMINGDPRSDDLSYTKAPGIKDANTRTETNKILLIEMDSELIQGATLEVWYDITVTNNSEIDYNYDIDKTNYYYYGEKDNLELIDTSVELVVDYMNPQLVCNVGADAQDNVGDKPSNNSEWHKYDMSADEFIDLSSDKSKTPITYELLKEKGYVSSETANYLKNSEYQIFATDTFKNVKPGESKTSTMYASKLLANKDDADKHVYDNHTEIVQINSKTARTIKGVEDGSRIQIEKEYMPGNYVPATTLQEQDDDNVRIMITPPTGISNYIISYVIAAFVGLIAIIGGIIFIKKTVIKK